MRYIDAWKMEDCVYTIYQSNEGNRFYIFRKEKDGNSNQLRVAFKSAEDAKAWVNNVLIPAWRNWHDCNKLAGQAYLDDPDELNESQLRNIIKESIKKVLKENVKTDIFTIDAFDIQDEESVDVMRYTGVDYESEEEAISAARELAQSLSSWDNVVIVSVYAGQYNDGKGNVFGEPFDIYTISNKDKNTTMIARKNAGYASLEVDEYIGN
jgi:hypothetical protein